MKLRVLTLAALLILPLTAALGVVEARDQGGAIPLGKWVAELPRGSQKIGFKLTPHFYADGLFYKKSGPGWVVVLPPIGAVVRGRPRSAVPVTANATRFYYHEGFFYRRRGSANYQVVQAPSGAVVRTLPKRFRRTLINGRVHYWYAGVTYRPLSKSRQTSYVVLGI
jgi:hypothetical protein